MKKYFLHYLRKRNSHTQDLITLFQCLVSGSEGQRTSAPGRIPSEIYKIISNNLNEERNEVELNLCELMKSSAPIVTSLNQDEGNKIFFCIFSPITQGT